MEIDGGSLPIEESFASIPPVSQAGYWSGEVGDWIWTRRVGRVESRELNCPIWYALCHNFHIWIYGPWLCATICSFSFGDKILYSPLQSTLHFFKRFQRVICWDFHPAHSGLALLVPILSVEELMVSKKRILNTSCCDIQRLQQGGVPFQVLVFLCRSCRKLQKRSSPLQWFHEKGGTFRINTWCRFIKSSWFAIVERFFKTISSKWIVFWIQSHIGKDGQKVQKMDKKSKKWDKHPIFTIEQPRLPTFFFFISNKSLPITEAVGGGGFLEEAVGFGQAWPEDLAVFGEICDQPKGPPGWGQIFLVPENKDSTWK